MNALGKVAIGIAAGVVFYQVIKVRTVRNALVDAVVDGSVYVIKRKLKLT